MTETLTTQAGSNRRDVLQADRAELRDTIRVTIDRELVDELDRQRASVSRSEYLEMVLAAALKRDHPHLADDWTPERAGAERYARLQPLPADRPLRRPRPPSLSTRRTPRMPVATTRRQLPPRSAPQAQETRDVQRYLTALFGRETPGALIDVRWRYRGGMSQRFLPHHDTYSAARAILRLGLRSDVYVGVAPRRARAGGKDAIERLWALWVDLDAVDAAAALERLPVAPSIVIASGTAGHLHAYWTLSHPVTVKAAEQANRRLAAELGGDTGAVTNAATILRPCGTHSFKTKPPTPVVLERLDATLTTLEAVTDGIAADPSPPAPTPRRAEAAAPAAARAGVDPLRALEPAHVRRRAHRRDRRALQEGELPLPRGPHPQPARLRERGRRLVLLRLQTLRAHRLRPRW